MKGLLFAALNGDGLRKTVRPNPARGTVRWNTGAGFAPPEDLVNGPRPDGANVTPEMDQGAHVADINSDGREDIIAFHFWPSPMIVAHFSLGDGSFKRVELPIWPGHISMIEGFTTS